MTFIRRTPRDDSVISPMGEVNFVKRMLDSVLFFYILDYK